MRYRDLKVSFLELAIMATVAASWASEKNKSTSILEGNKGEWNETSAPSQAQTSVFLTPFFLQLLNFQTKQITQFLLYPAKHLPLDNELDPYNLPDINPSQLKCEILVSVAKINPAPVWQFLEMIQVTTQAVFAPRFKTGTDCFQCELSS